jgi:hypothetical protein
MKDLLKGKDGESSSKRVAGFIVTIGVLGIALFAIAKDPSQANQVLWPLVSLAGVCFGATAAERMTGK